MTKDQQRNHFEYIVAIFAGILLCALFSSQALAKTDQVSAERCRTAREYITSLEYLRDKKETLGVDESQLQNIAQKVSAGCTGSAKRFVRIVNWLMQVEAGSKNAIQMGVAAAQKTDENVDVFIEVFKKAYLEKHLDLDLRTSLKMAKALAIDYKGDVSIVAKDFKAIVQFCQSEELGLSLPQCADVANEIVPFSEKSQESVSQAFIKAYRFMRSEGGLGVASGDALKLSRELVKIDPLAVDNFVEAYQYAVSKKGLSLDAKKAMKFAKQMSKKTIESKN